MTQWGIDTLFNPGKRHMDEEKRRLQSTREEVGDSSGGKRIDLESGKVRLPGKDEAEPGEQAPAAQDGTPESQDGTPEGRDGTSGTPDGTSESPAAADESEDSPAARARRRRRAG